MDFIAAIKSGFRNYGNFRGIATRSEYWFWVLFIVLSMIVLSILESAIWPPMYYPAVGGYGMPDMMGSAMSGASPLSDIFGIGILVPTLAMTARRFHDAGFSGKWQWLQLGTLVLLFIGMLGFGVALYSGATGMYPGVALDPYTFVFALLSTMAPALLFGLAYSVFQLVVALRPSKSAAAGNKYAAPVALETPAAPEETSEPAKAAAPVAAAEAAPAPAAEHTTENAATEEAPAKPAAKRKAAPKKVAPSDD